MKNLKPKNFYQQSFDEFLEKSALRKMLTKFFENTEKKIFHIQTETANIFKKCFCQMPKAYEQKF